MTDNPTQDQAPEADQADDQLPPLSVLDDMLRDVQDVLAGVDELVVEHRRADREDPRALERLQYVTQRVNQAWVATQLARKALKDW